MNSENFTLTHKNKIKLEEFGKFIRENKVFKCGLSLISITYQGKVTIKIKTFLDKLILSGKAGKLIVPFT